MGINFIPFVSETGRIGIDPARFAESIYDILLNLFTYVKILSNIKPKNISIFSTIEKNICDRNINLDDKEVQFYWITMILLL